MGFRRGLETAVGGKGSGEGLPRLLAEAVSAVDRPVAPGLERQVGLPAAGGALRHEDLPGTFAESARTAGPGRDSVAGRPEAAGRAGAAAPVVVPHPRHLAADHAALGFVPEPQLGVMFLLLGGEDEIFVAVLALQGLVRERHD